MASAVPNSGSQTGRASTTIPTASPSAPSFSRVLGTFTYPKNRQMSPVKVGATAVTDHTVVLIGSLRGPGLTNSAMTTLVPGAALQPNPAAAPTVHQYVRYLFYKARPSWRQLSVEQRDAAR